MAYEAPGDNLIINSLAVHPTGEQLFAEEVSLGGQTLTTYAWLLSNYDNARLTEFHPHQDGFGVTAQRCTNPPGVRACLLLVDGHGEGFYGKDASLTQFPLEVFRESDHYGYTSVAAANRAQWSTQEYIERTRMGRQMDGAAYAAVVFEKRDDIDNVVATFISPSDCEAVHVRAPDPRNGNRCQADVFTTKLTDFRVRQRIESNGGVYYWGDSRVAAGDNNFSMPGSIGDEELPYGVHMGSVDDGDHAYDRAVLQSSDTVLLYSDGLPTALRDRSSKVDRMEQLYQLVGNSWELHDMVRTSYPQGFQPGTAIRYDRQALQDNLTFFPWMHQETARLFLQFAGTAEAVRMLRDRDDLQTISAFARYYVSAITDMQGYRIDDITFAATRLFE